MKISDLDQRNSMRPELIIVLTHLSLLLDLIQIQVEMRKTYQLALFTS